MDLSRRLQGTNPTIPVVYSPEPRAEVYCSYLIKISKLAYSILSGKILYISQKINNYCTVRTEQPDQSVHKCNAYVLLNFEESW